MPECTPCRRVDTSRSPSTSPRRVTVSEGVSTSQLSESATTITSAESRSRWVRRNSASDGDPDSSSPSTKTTTPTPSSGPQVGSRVRRAATWAITPALSSAVPRPYRRPSRSVGRKAGLVQSSSSPGGCTSWWAYSSTVGFPSGAGRRATTAGAPSLPSGFAARSTCTSSSPAPRSRSATASALSATCAWSKAPADTLGIRTSASRSARTPGICASRAARRAATSVGWPAVGMVVASVMGARYRR